MIYRWFTLLLALLLVAQPLDAHARSGKRKKRTARTQQAPPRPQLPIVPKEVPTDPAAIQLIADGAVLMDGRTGEELWAKNGNERFYPASSTKMLTALLVLEAGGLDELVTIELVDTQVEPSAIYFKPGEQYTRRELLYALMLKSANDVAQALARDNAGSVEAFAEKMTRRAHQLGAVNSHFMNPHGLHHVEHYSTPHDLALIARYAMQLPTFRQIVSTTNYDWAGGANGPMKLRNTNRLLRDFPGCTGLKTGYTVKAQHVLVSAAKQNGREVISVVMHSDKFGKWTDSGMLLSYGLHQLGALPAAAPEAVAQATRRETAPEAAGQVGQGSASEEH